jgi:shikimate kinase
MRWQSTDGRPLFLVGMMGAGKSTVGRLLATKLAVPFVDLDERIAAEAGATIPEIFADEGEDGFRNREAAALVRACSAGAAIVAAGGGAVRFGDNLDRMLDAGLLIWLDAPIEALAARVGDARDRPLLATGDPKQKLQQLLDERRPFYARAQLRIDAAGPPSQVCELILKELA